MMVKVEKENDTESKYSEMSIKEYACRARRGAQMGSYIDKLAYAAFRKRMEGDTEYASAIEALEEALISLDEDADESKDLSVMVARKTLDAIREKRSPYATFNYHKYMFDSVPHTLKPFRINVLTSKDGEITLPDCPTTEDLFCYIIQSDAYEIGQLLDMSAEEVLGTQPQELLAKLEALDLPDHPERYVMTNIYIPSPQTLKYLGVLDDFIEAYVNSPQSRKPRYAFLDKMYGTGEDRGVYKNAIHEKGKEMPYWVRQDIVRALRYEDFDLDCYAEGGLMESEKKYWEYIKEHPHR